MLLRLPCLSVSDLVCSDEDHTHCQCAIGFYASDVDANSTKVLLYSSFPIGTELTSHACASLVAVCCLKVNCTSCTRGMKCDQAGLTRHTIQARSCPLHVFSLFYLR